MVLTMTLAHDISNGSRTPDIKITQDVTFDTMLLSEKMLQGLKSSGFTRPSPIQLNGIPLGKCGFDLLLEAKSGTGKTAVFSVIALEKLDLHKGLQTVIIAPTREIAFQICDVLRAIGSEYKDLVVEVVMGGLSVQEDFAKFKAKNRVHIVVGCPGRLRHLIQGKHMDVSSVRLLVLDEADKLMEKSFKADINFIYSALPKEKQVIMSSATYPQKVRAFIDSYMKNSQHVCPDTTTVLLGIEQRVTMVEYNPYILKQTKFRYKELVNILSKTKFKQCLIFCNYQVRVGEVHRMLTADEWPAAQLHGQQEQADRLNALKTLQEYKCRILIATDLAARGIDASNVDLVINFEPPYEWLTYLHRIGRAGRYGSYGMAVTVLSKGDEENKFKELLNAMKYSVNIVDMWSNEKFIYNDQDVTKEMKNKDERIEIKTVWKELNSSGSQESQNLALKSFENLLTDFEQCVIGSETNDEGIDDTYKHLSLEEINVSGNELSDTNKKSNQSTPKIKLEDRFELNNNSLTTKAIKSKYIENEQTLTSIDSTNESKKYVSEKTYEECIFDEMKMLGLPTSFGGKKYNVSDSDHYNNEIDNYVTKKQAHKTTETKYNRKPMLVSEHHKVKTNSKKNKYNASENHYDNEIVNNDNKEAHKINDSKYNRKPLKSVSEHVKIESTSNKNKYCASENYYYNNEIENYDTKTKYNRKDDRKPSKVVSENVRVESNSNKNNCTRSRRCCEARHSNDIVQHSSRTTNSQADYLTWYKQLKIRTKQIEMAYYIEEMSQV